MRGRDAVYFVLGLAMVGGAFAAGSAWQKSAVQSSATSAPHEVTLSNVTAAANEPMRLPELNPAKKESKNSPPASSEAASSASAQISVLFSPQDPIQRTLISMVNQAQRSILVQVYIFTDDTLANALIRARKRGVDVQVLLDAQSVNAVKGSEALRLYEAGIPVRLETQYENAHNKIMIIDHDTTFAAVVTGSYNFTFNAQRANAENIVIIRQSPAMIRRYVENWQNHAVKAIAYGANPVS